MNERIKELAKQAGYTEDAFGIGHWDMPECKKFAELIIGECLDQIDKSSVCFTQEQANIKELAKNQIIRHFGVEE